MSRKKVSLTTYRRFYFLALNRRVNQATCKVHPVQSLLIATCIGNVSWNAKNQSHCVFKYATTNEFFCKCIFFSQLEPTELLRKKVGTMPQDGLWTCALWNCPTWAECVQIRAELLGIGTANCFLSGGGTKKVLFDWHRMTALKKYTNHFWSLSNRLIF